MDKLVNINHLILHILSVKNIYLTFYSTYIPYTFSFN